MERYDTSVTVTADALDNDARGICSLPSGKKVFVPGLLPGETAVIDIIKEEKRYSAGILKELSVTSPDRILPAGSMRAGCNLSHLSYPAQLKYKEEKVRSCLERIGKIPCVILDRASLPIIASDNTASYRNHMQYKISEGRCCLMIPGTNDPVYEDHYLPEPDIFTSVRKAFEDIFYGAPTRGFSELILRGSLRTKQLMAELVSGLPDPHEIIIRDAKDYLAATDSLRRIQSAAPGYEITGITLRISETKTKKRTRSGKRVILWGKDSYREILCKKTFEIRSGAFFQVNTDQAELLYREASRYTQDAEVIYDVYCGTGSIGLSVINEGQTLIGLEAVREAVESAKINASLSGVHNASFICRNAEDSDLFGGKLLSPDIVIVDPPRKGMHNAFTSKLIKAAPPKILYISCDPATLARDIAEIRKGGYEIETYRPVDLFPSCSNVECCMLLKRVGQKQAL